MSRIPQLHPRLVLIAIFIAYVHTHMHIFLCVYTDGRGTCITCRDRGGGDSTDTSVAVAELSTQVVFFLFDVSRAIGSARRPLLDFKGFRV